MPELPEVEITRRRLGPLLMQRRVSQVHTTKPSYFFLTPPATLKRKLQGQTFVDLERHGKYLVARLESGAGLLLHLGMTGQLFSSQATSPRLMRHGTSVTPEVQRSFKPDEHTHLRLHFSDGGPVIFFRDVRKFGKCRWLEAGQSDPRLAELGPDALDAESADLFRHAQRRAVPIKTLLLNQRVLAGVGNIYADEALFGAKIAPSRAARTLSQKECTRLVLRVRQVLLRAIESGGSSISDFVHPDGSDGSFQNERRVYARTGEPCSICRTPIERLVIGQRSSHFCPRCQR